MSRWTRCAPRCGTVRTTPTSSAGAATVILAAGAGRAAGMAIDKFLKDGEWWDPNAPKPEVAPAAK